MNSSLSINPKKVLHIVLNPFTHDSRVLKEANSLSKAGYRVKVLAVQNERGNLPAYETQSGFEVQRIHLVTKKLPKLKPFQFIKYIEYILQALIVLKNFNPCIVHCHDLDPLPIGIFSRKLVVYDTHEFQRGRNNLKNKYEALITGSIESLLAKHVDAVITINQEIANMLSEVLGRKTFFLFNADSKEQYSPNKSFESNYISLREKLSLPGHKKIIVYAGGLTYGRGLTKLLESVAYLADEIVIVLIGYGDLECSLKRTVRKRGLSDRVFILPPVSHNEVSHYIASSDLGLMPTENTSLSYKLGLGNKFFHYISAGIPLAVSNQPVKRALVEKYGLGIIIDPEDSKGMAKEINSFLSNIELQRKCRENVKKALTELNWEREEKKLISLYSELINKQ